MYFMYVDESGDSGTVNSPTNDFILSAIVFHELRWQSILRNLLLFRRELKEKKGLKIKDEIHSKDFINSPGDLVRIKRNNRLDILKQCLDWLNSQPDINVFSVCVHKNGKQDDVFELAWNALIMRFENTISHKNFSGPQNADDRGIILSDNTEGKKLQMLVRKMRHYNTIPNTRGIYGGGYRNMTLQYVIEDPVFRDSKQSLIHQMNDVVAYFARQHFTPNSYIKKKGGHNYYKRLKDVIVKKVTKSNDLGIVEL